MSQPVTFEPGIHYVLLGESYQVIQVLNDGMLVAKNLATNAHFSHQITQLWHHWQAQTLEFTLQGVTSAPPLLLPILPIYQPGSRISPGIAINSFVRSLLSQLTPGQNRSSSVGFRSIIRRLLPL